MTTKFMDKYSSPVSYVWGGLCALFGALSLNEIAILIGIIISVATFIINWTYKRRDYLHKKKIRESALKEIKKRYESINENSNQLDL